jgi:hypothetical protein
VAGGLAGKLQPWLSAAPVGELDLLSSAIASLELRYHPDTRWLPGPNRGAPRATNFYNAIRAPASPPPLTELNWDTLAPKKVQIFL